MNTELYKRDAKQVNSTQSISDALTLNISSPFPRCHSVPCVCVPLTPPPPPPHPPRHPPHISFSREVIALYLAQARGLGFRVFYVFFSLYLTRAPSRAVMEYLHISF